MHIHTAGAAVSVGHAVFEQFNAWLGQQNFSKVFFLVDEHTHECCLPSLLAALSHLETYEVLEVEAGEESKSPEVLVNLYYALTELEADRHALLVNVGGGVVTDLGGFLAATYKRGISFVHFPSSLLAMVDASVGGKTGIDLGPYKNQVGAFAEPLGVYVYPDFLETLAAKHVRAGFAEMLKHGFIADRAYLDVLAKEYTRGTPPSVSHIERSIEIKAEIVAQDFREGGDRKKLNFGHSFGHAFEGVYLAAGNAILHGEAVAIGMLAELYLSKKKLHLPEEQFKQGCTIVENIFGRTDLSVDAEKVFALLKNDKKNEAGKLRFVLLPELGRAQVDVEVSEEEAMDALHFLMHTKPA